MYKRVYVGIFDRNSRRGEAAIDLQDLLLIVYKHYADLHPPCLLSMRLNQVVPFHNTPYSMTFITPWSMIKFFVSRTF